MLPHDVARVAAERDEVIRFDTHCGEKQDSTDSFLIDHCLALGADCVKVVKTKAEKERAAKVKIIETYIS